MTSIPTEQELENLRREVDRLDGAVVDLLAERMQVVAAIARLKRGEAEVRPAIRPGREAVILRRLVAHAAGRFPSDTLVRMWRELLAASTRAQAPLAIVACVPPDQPRLWDLARDHFGSLTPVQRTESASQALRLVAENPTRLAVLPAPDEDQLWWTALLDGGPHPLRVVARLPFAGDEAEERSALVIGSVEPEPSGDDACLIAIEIGDGISRARLLELLGAWGTVPRWLAAAPTPAGTWHLLELAGCLVPPELDLDQAPASAREHILRSVWLGGYARPLAAAS